MEKILKNTLNSLHSVPSYRIVLLKNILGVNKITLGKTVSNRYLNTFLRGKGRCGAEREVSLNLEYTESKISLFFSFTFHSGPF